jgi:hypothetical protein
MCHFPNDLDMFMFPSETSLIDSKLIVEALHKERHITLSDVLKD